MTQPTVLTEEGRSYPFAYKVSIVTNDEECRHLKVPLGVRGKETLEYTR